ncbi:hypothetical protein KL953_20945 [Mycolicibacterium goodii]|uniref:rhomboid-like protein n=1 Tax=Mycolicibacterium goodii TaxID=134601 RepID=UPI001BDD2C9E|nr:rhomboid-like protein [Mycolicibacterium goodii]MBU8811351.1 hypothetical protein [Mycolicibacterium goodii]
MCLRFLSGVVRVRVTLSYAAALFTVASLLLLLGPRTQAQAVSMLSTNLHNLGQGQLGTLVGSAFVTAEGYTYLLMPGLVCLLALAEVLWCGRRLVQAFAFGHVGATVIVAFGLAYAIKAGWVPVSAATADDVGLSYGAVAVLGALTSSLPVLWRTGWAAGWLTIAVVVAAAGVDFTAIGHAVALVLGMLLSVRYRSDDRWTRSRKSLLAVGIAFGALLLVGASPSVAPFALGGGMLVAASITAVRRRLHRRPRSVDEGAMGAALA